MAFAPASTKSIAREHVLGAALKEELVGRGGEGPGAPFEAENYLRVSIFSNVQGQLWHGSEAKFSR